MNTQYKVWFGTDLGCGQYVWEFSQILPTKKEAEHHMNEILRVCKLHNHHWDSGTIEEIQNN